MLALMHRGSARQATIFPRSASDRHHLCRSCSRASTPATCEGDRRRLAVGRNGAIDGAAAALFAAGIAVRTQGRVLWCVTGEDLFAPALASAGLAPDQVIYVEAGDEKAVLVCLEEALRHRKLGAVVAEVSRLSITASRRLQLASEDSGVIGLALRRWRRQVEAAVQPADCCDDALADQRAAIDTSASAGRRPRSTATRTGPVPQRRKCRVRSGGLDAQGRLALPAQLDHRPTLAKRRKAIGKGTYVALSGCRHTVATNDGSPLRIPSPRQPGAAFAASKTLGRVSHGGPSEIRGNGGPCRGSRCCGD
jgi:protein ImuA